MPTSSRTNISASSMCLAFTSNFMRDFLITEDRLRIHSSRLIVDGTYPITTTLPVSVCAVLTRDQNSTIRCVVSPSKSRRSKRRRLSPHEQHQNCELVPSLKHAPVGSGHAVHRPVTKVI